eukprot:12882677-Prorocentrum_lima.AAC.1
MFGEPLPVLPPAARLESLLRVELVDWMPKGLSRKCTHYGCQTSIDIVARTTRAIMPTQDLSRMSTPDTYKQEWDT